MSFMRSEIPADVLNDPESIRVMLEGRTIHVCREAVAWYVTPIKEEITLKVLSVREFKKAETLVCREIEDKLSFAIRGVRDDAMEFIFYMISDTTKVSELGEYLYIFC